MVEPLRLRTPEELRRIDETNYHGCISCLFTASQADSEGPTVRDVLDAIERRFGLTNPVENKLTTIEVAEMLIREMRDALSYLQVDAPSSPNMLGWFRSRADYLLSCAENRILPE